MCCRGMRGRISSSRRRAEEKERPGGGVVAVRGALCHLGLRSPHTATVSPFPPLLAFVWCCCFVPVLCGPSLTPRTIPACVEVHHHSVCVRD